MELDILKKRFEEVFKDTRLAKFFDLLEYEIFENLAGCTHFRVFSRKEQIFNEVYFSYQNTLEDLLGLIPVFNELYLLESYSSVAEAYSFSYSKKVDNVIADNINKAEDLIDYYTTNGDVLTLFQIEYSPGKVLKDYNLFVYNNFDVKNITYHLCFDSLTKLSYFCTKTIPRKDK